MTPEQTGVPCMNCGCESAWMIRTPVVPDFDLRIIDADLRSAFSRKDDGVCANCGLYQAYFRFTPEQLRRVNEIGKDELATFEFYHSYPLPEGFVDEFNVNVHAKSIPRWRRVFAELGHTPENVILLRYWFGARARFLSDEYGAKTCGVEMSHTCRRYVADHVPEFQDLDGEINGRFYGDFLESGPYDTVFSSHILCHSCDIHRMLGQIRNLVRDGGIVVFEAETKFAPTNPFHMIYLSEWQLYGLLSKYFDEVHKLDEIGLVRGGDDLEHLGSVIEHIAVVHPASGG